jgi:hypothetical protein
VNLWLLATFPRPSSILAIHFDNQLSTTTRTTRKDEDDLEAEAHPTKNLVDFCKCPNCKVRRPALPSPVSSKLMLPLSYQEVLFRCVASKELYRYLR